MCMWRASLIHFSLNFSEFLNDITAETHKPRFLYLLIVLKGLFDNVSISKTFSDLSFTLRAGFELNFNWLTFIIISLCHPSITAFNFQYMLALFKLYEAGILFIFIAKEYFTYLISITNSTFIWALFSTKSNAGMSAL